MYKKLMLKFLLASSLSTYGYAGKYQYNFDELFNWSKNKIAVLDSCFDTQHPLLKNNLEKGWNVEDNNDNVQPSCIDDINKKTASHGTHVTGIITQILPRARIVPIKLGQNADSTKDLLGALSYVDQISFRDNIKLINISAKLDDFSFENEMFIKSLAERGIMMIISAGNTSTPLNSDTQRGQVLINLLKDPIIKEHLIIVGQTTYDTIPDSNSYFTKKADSSSYPDCDIIKQNFIITLGTCKSSVPYYYNKEGMELKSGTSMSTSVITSYIATLMQNYNISSTKAWKVLRKTAVKENSNKFDVTNTGQGIADINAAIKYLNEKRDKHREAHQQEEIKKAEQAREQIKKENDIIRTRDRELRSLITKDSKVDNSGHLSVKIKSDLEKKYDERFAKYKAEYQSKGMTIQDYVISKGYDLKDRTMARYVLDAKVMEEVIAEEEASRQAEQLRQQEQAREQIKKENDIIRTRDRELRSLITKDSKVDNSGHLSVKIKSDLEKKYDERFAKYKAEYQSKGMTIQDYVISKGYDLKDRTMARYVLDAKVMEEVIAEEEASRQAEQLRQQEQAREQIKKENDIIRTRDRELRSLITKDSKVDNSGHLSVKIKSDLEKKYDERFAKYKAEYQSKGMTIQDYVISKGYDLKDRTMARYVLDAKVMEEVIAEEEASRQAEQLRQQEQAREQIKKENDIIRTRDRELRSLITKDSKVDNSGHLSVKIKSDLEKKYDERFAKYKAEYQSKGMTIQDYVISKGYDLKDRTMARYILDAKVMEDVIAENKHQQ